MTHYQIIVFIFSNVTSFPYLSSHMDFIYYIVFMFYSLSKVAWIIK